MLHHESSVPPRTKVWHVTESSAATTIPMTRYLALALVALLADAATARADTADRLLQLLSVPGVAGYETAVREAIEMLLPAGARVGRTTLATS